MSNLGLKVELRDGNTIRAYLDELVLLKSPIQLWVTQTDAPPFITTIARVLRDTFTTNQTPVLTADQQLNISFSVEARRFTAHTQAVSNGVFKIPTSVAQGERRERFRAPFNASDGIEVFACEKVSPPFVLGRSIAGRMVDLSPQGLRVALEDVTSLQGEPPAPFKRGDTLASVCITGLPYTPTLQCEGIVAHVLNTPDGPMAGLMLTELQDSDQRNIERILARRFPTTFGQAFPKKKRKTDIADQAGAPVPAKVEPKAPEVIAVPVAEPAPAPERPPRPEVTAAMRIRKAICKILVIGVDTPGVTSMADNLREDDFKQVYQAKSYLEAMNLAKSNKFDILLLEAKVGGHLGQMILESLRRNDLLLDTPVILIADLRDASIETVAEEIDAFHVHDKRAHYEDILPALYSLL